MLTTEGGSREDGSVYYARYLIVSSDTLQFNEPVFCNLTISVGTIEGIADDEDEDYVDQTKLIEHIRSIGYTVVEPESSIITTEEP